MCPFLGMRDVEINPQLQVARYGSHQVASMETSARASTGYGLHGLHWAAIKRHNLHIKKQILKFEWPNIIANLNQPANKYVYLGNWKGTILINFAGWWLQPIPKT